MTHATTTTSTAAAMGNGNKKHVSNSLSAGDISKHSSKVIDNKDVAKWSSSEVHQWIKEQCKRFDLKKATVEKFEMNGQALVLLTKHDFLRRSPDGGEILYYALQRLINPGKTNSARSDQSSLKNGSSTSPRIVEINVDNDDPSDVPDLTTPKPIIEEPDDPPKIRRSHSEANPYGQEHAHPYFFNQVRLSPSVVTMPVGAAAAYFHQQRQAYPNGYLHPNHHSHLHMNQPHFYHPNLFQHYHPMMSARGILIEVMDDIDPANYTSNGVNGSANGASTSAPETLYMVTMNGQQYVMNEEQVRQLVTEVYQQQTYQENLQQQQHFHQQQQFYQQQQQHFQRQQQQNFQQPYPFQEQPQQQQQQQQRFP